MVVLFRKKIGGSELKWLLSAIARQLTEEPPKEILLQTTVPMYFGIPSSKIARNVQPSSL